MKDVEIGRVEYIHVALKQEAYPGVPRLVLAVAVLVGFSEATWGPLPPKLDEIR